MKEIETRIINIDVNSIRQKLFHIKAAKVKEEKQQNIIFDFPNRLLLENKGYARIRIVEDLIKKEERYYMTTKFMLTQSDYKIMEEHEILISDSKEGINIFKALGLVEMETIKKYRESYRYKDALIEIDVNDISYFPYPYIEIEAATEEEIKEVVSKLNYTMSDTTSKTIHELVKNLDQEL